MQFCDDYDPQMDPPIEKNRKEFAWYLLLGGQGAPGSSPGTILGSPKTLENVPERLPRREAPKGFQEAPKRIPRESKWEDNQF